MALNQDVKKQGAEKNVLTDEDHRLATLLKMGDVAMFNATWGKDIDKAFERIAA